jgi:hypothetical protein
MEYIIGAAIAAIIFFIFAAKRKVNDFNKMCLLDFSTWHSVFISSDAPEKNGIARAFLLQSLHLAENTGVINSAEKNELELGLRVQDPIKTVNDWLEFALPHVKEVCGGQQLSCLDARLAGVLMLVCLSGVNPQGDLTRYLQKLNSIDLKRPRTIINEAQDAGGKLIVSGYRSLADQQSCAPTEKTSDQQIIEIYRKVCTAFREVSDQRGEHLTAGTLNHIVWKFLNVSEMLGAEMVDEHLAYEIQKYRQEGLRPDYRQDLQLF